MESRDEILKRDWSNEFITKMENAIETSHYKYGWMSDEYIQAVIRSLDNVQRLARQLHPEYRLIVTADHGGHNRSHGSEDKEDMTIPIFLRHSTIAPGALPENINIVDIAPTITSILGVDPDPDWEGKSLL